MWLISTKDATLSDFSHDEILRKGGYAILSHVWGRKEDEDTFQEVQGLAKVPDVYTRWTRVSVKVRTADAANTLATWASSGYGSTRAVSIRRAARN